MIRALKIPAEELFRQKTDNLRVVVEQRADILVRVIDSLIETACQRKLTVREADIGDGAVQSLKEALDNLEAHRLAGV